MEQCFKYLSNPDHRLYKATQDWYNHVGDMLAYINDELSAQDFDDIIRDDFAALRQRLQRRTPSGVGSLRSTTCLQVDKPN
jgi:hypothetical protein